MNLYFEGTTRVVDATEDLLIPLKGSDTKGAAKSNPEDCIIAHAADRVKAIKHRRIGAKFARVVFHEDPETEFRYQLSDSTKAKRASFDANGVVDPAWVDGNVAVLRPVSPAYAQGYKTGKPGSNKRRKKPQKRQASSRRIDVIPGKETKSRKVMA